MKTSLVQIDGVWCYRVIILKCEHGKSFVKSAIGCGFGGCLCGVQWVPIASVNMATTLCISGGCGGAIEGRPQTGA